MVPGTETAIASLLAALGGGAMNYFGKPQQAENINLPTRSPTQTGAMDQLLQQGMGNMDLSGLEDKYMRQFQQEMIPSISERFAGMGEGALGSGGFEKALLGGSSDLLQNLMSMRPQMGLQQLQMGLQPQFEAYHQPERPGGMQQLGSLFGELGTSAMGPSLGLMGKGRQQKHEDETNFKKQKMQTEIKNLLSQLIAKQKGGV